MKKHHREVAEVECVNDEMPFMNLVNNMISLHCSRLANKASYLHYVATNEHNITQLDSLRRNGFTLFGDLLHPNSHVNKTQLEALTPQEKYVLELMLMCRSSCFITFGKSTSRMFLEKCREIQRIQSPHLIIWDAMGS